MHLPIRTRLTITATVLMAVVLLVVGVFGVWWLSEQVAQARDAGLRSRAEQTLAAVTDGGSLAAAGSVIESDEAFAQVLDAEGNVVDESPGLTGAPLVLPEEVRVPGFVDRTVETTEEQVPSRLFVVDGPVGTTLVVGASLEDEQDSRRLLVVVTSIGGTATLALSAAVIWFVTGAALRPVESLRQEAAQISPDDLGHRVAVPDTGDEIARLAETLNEMLARLEKTWQGERRLIGDASHELRTPLANLRAEIDLALRDPDDAARLTTALRSAGEETDRLTHLVQQLLVLSLAEHGRLELARDPVDLAALAFSVAGSFEARAGERSVAVTVTGPASVTLHGDADRLRQALENLIDNALRHSPSGSTVEVLLDADDSSCTVSVMDAGEGFDPAFLPTAFDPFTRADAGRTRSAGGAGLGLSIVRAVADAHGGQVAASNRRAGGGVVTLTLPRD